MNRIAVTAALRAQEKLEAENVTMLSIPLGDILSSRFFTGQGPAILFRTQPLGSVDTSFASEFSEAGINQTRHRIYLRLRADMRMLAAGMRQTAIVETEVLISDAIIVGEVPQTYANVAGATDFLNLLP